jgi:galactokinase
LIDSSKVRDEFRTMFHAEPRLFRAPGRANLIGEHTDYNDGFVLPIAIDRDTVVAARARQDRKVRVHSGNVGETRCFDLDAPQPESAGWLNYVFGIARALEERGAELTGADMFVDSDVPEVAGLSSSAALEIYCGLALLSVAGATTDRTALALAAQNAEHRFVGTLCGIMDQFVAVFGAADNALLIDCRSITSTLVPLQTARADILICDSGVKHELAGSAYNTRRRECERGVELLRRDLPDIRALRDVSVGEWDLLEERFPVPIRQRCRHVVHENARTLQAADALRAGQLEKMGLLMARSHRSLRDDYEVSCSELDTLVEIANQVHGVYGARMMGGGFGGSTVNLVRREAREDFIEAVSHRYFHARGMKPAIYVVRASRGACEIH